MLKIKKQINLLYITSMLGNLSVTGAWVAILAARGFSLVEIGFAETVFHITSLICEIPSGILADIYGRKKMLIVSHIMAIIGNTIMVFSNGIGMVCLSFVFQALTYNFASGSGDALAYDSLKCVKQENRYEKYFSNQMIIYRIGTAISTLCAGVALLMGYRLAYVISAIWHVPILILTEALVEVRVETPVKEYPDVKRIIRELLKYFADSLRFLKNNVKATKLMFANSFVGAMDILLLFFLQAKLTNAGIENRALGIALFLMEMGGIVGSKLILKSKKARYVSIFVICSIGVASGVILEHTGLIPIMVLGGFISAMADDALQVRTDAKLQDMFPSEQRATLISMGSFTFSVIMIVLSPLAGYFFSIW